VIRRGVGGTVIPVRPFPFRSALHIAVLLLALGCKSKAPAPPARPAQAEPEPWLLQTDPEFAELFGRLEAFNADPDVKEADRPLETVENSRLALPPGPYHANLRELLYCENATHRYNAAKALGKTGDPSVIPYLAQAQTDSSSSVRRAAVKAVEEILKRNPAAR